MVSRSLDLRLGWGLAAPTALLAGAALVLAFAPFGLWPIAVPALAAFLLALQGRDTRGAFAIGWLFGVALLGLGVAWIRISLNEFGNMPAAAANALMLLFVAAMALYYGLLGALVQRLSLHVRPWAAALLLFPGLWVLLEWLRGWLFTGFPWLSVGTGQIDGPLRGLAPVLGVYGLSLAVAFSAGLLVCALRWRGRPALAAAGTLVLLWAGAGLMARLDWTRPAGAPLTVSVIQGNVEQSVKWDADGLLPTLGIYLGLTGEHLDSDVVVWPETAVPDFLHNVERSLITPLAETAREHATEVVIGLPVMETAERYYNGLISLGSADDRYYKRHLVPFGEFLPFAAQLRPLIDWFEVPMSNFSRGRVARPLLQVGPHAVGASICYEDVFAAEVRQALPDARFLINVSNDAWFGDSLAPHQHLQSARLRALENGRWLVRATNTGISAIIDPRGRVSARLPLFERAVLTGEITPRVGSTPFAAAGSAVALMLAVALVLAALLLRRRAAQPPRALA